MRTRAVWLTISMVAVLGTAAPADSAESGRELRAAAKSRSVQKALRKARAGDVVVIEPGTFTGRIAVKRAGVTIRAEGVVLRSRKAGKKALVIRGDGVAVSGLAVAGGRITVDADDVTLHGLSVAGVPHRTAVEVHGDDLHLEDCRFARVELSNRSVAVVAVDGDRAVLRGNTAEQVIARDGLGMAFPERAFLRVTGRRAVLQHNRLDAGVGIRGITVAGDDAIVADNELRWTSTGVVVLGAGADVHRNVLDDGQGVALHVTGDGAAVTKNLARGRTGDGLRVRGDAFRVTDNIVTTGGFVSTPPAIVAEALGVPPRTAAPTGGYDPPVIQGGAQGCPAIVLDGDGGSIADNRLEYAFGNAISARTSNSTIRDNALVPTARESGTAIFIERGDANVVQRNDVTPTDFAAMVALDVRGTGNEIRENLVDATYFFSLRGIAVTGRDNVVEDNDLPGVHARAMTVSGGRNIVRRNAILEPKIGLAPTAALDVGPLIDVWDDENVVEDNVITRRNGDEWATGVLSAVFVRGRRNRVRGNRVDGLAATGTIRVTGLRISGDGNEVRDNDVVDYGDRAVAVVGDDNVVDGNLAENTIGRPTQEQGTRATTAAFLVTGARNEVCVNQSTGAWGTGFLVSGTDCGILRNVARDAGGHGFDVAGDAHDVCANDSFDAGASGFVVAQGTGVLVEECRAIGSRACGIESDVTDASIVKSTFTGSGVRDVHVTGTLDVFQDNTYDTLLR